VGNGTLGKPVCHELGDRCVIMSYLNLVTGECSFPSIRMAPHSKHSPSNTTPSYPNNGGDRVAFDQLYREHVDQIYRLAQRMCGHPDDARDVVQETFLNAYRKYKQFRGDSQISTWLYTIASRACLRMHRRRKGEPQKELSLQQFIPTSKGEFQLQIPIQGLTPEQFLEKKELRKALHVAIQKLPNKYRLVLVLRDMEGLPAKEVGSIMGLNERAVKSRLHRARLFIRKELSSRGVPISKRASRPLKKS